MKINTPSMWFRQVNAQWPWLKVVVLVVFVLLMGVGIEEVLRHGVAQPIRSGDSQVDEGVAVIEEAPSEADLKTETKSDEKTEQKEEKTDEQKPASVTTTPVVPVEQHNYNATGRKLIAMTFDDGPSTATTPRLLDILKEKGVKATFFVVGTRLGGAGAEILQREVREGHEVGSHTLSHANLVKLDAAGIQTQVTEMDRLFQNILGTKPQVMRPPYGSVNQTVRNVMPQPMILWTIDPEDWKYRNAVRVRDSSVRGAFDGAILLLHDIHSTSVDAVPGIIDDLKAQGYEFLTISEMAAERGVVLQKGATYGSFRP